MAKRTKPGDVVCKSCIHMGNKLVDTDALSPRQRTYVATKLKQAYLNELFAGRAEFFPAGPLPPVEEVFAEYL